jgi:hypothetical protein
MTLEDSYDHCTRIDQHTGMRCDEKSVRFFVLDLVSGWLRDQVYGRCAPHALDEIRLYRVREVSPDEVVVMEVHES